MTLALEEITLVEQDLDIAAERFIARAERLTNGVENLCDKLWGEYNAVLSRRTQQAYEAMLKLIAGLPEHSDPEKAKQGYIDFQSAAGKSKRNRFLRDMAAVYANWEKGILADLDIKNWKPDAPPWERSLGIHDHRAGHFLMRLRDEIARKAHDLAHILDQGTEAVAEGMTYQQFQKRAADFFGGRSGKVAVGKVSKAASGATEKITSAGMKVLRQVGRKPAVTQAKHSPEAQETIMGKVKGVVHDQEKSWTENVLMGLEQLARKHANDVYDTSSGTVFRDDLKKTAKAFSSGEISKRQQQLSVMTHVRAMVRRIATSPAYHEQVTGVKLFLQVPPTRLRDVDIASASIANRAYRLTTLPELVQRAKGMGDSLGLFAGDPVQPIPVAPGMEEAVKKAAEKARDDYIAKFRKRMEREGD